MRPYAKSDWTYLRHSLLLFLLCLLCGAAMIWLSLTFLQHTQSALEQARLLLAASRNRLEIVQDESARLPVYSARYSELSSQKILSGENRLDLLESLERAGKHHKLRSLRYNITPQEAYLHAGSGKQGMNSRISKLNLQAELIHEVQLLDFLSTLRAESNGLFVVTGCTLEPNTPSGPLPENNLYPLHAECNGGWITMQYGL